MLFSYSLPSKELFKGKRWIRAKALHYRSRSFHNCDTSKMTSSGGYCHFVLELRHLMQVSKLQHLCEDIRHGQSFPHFSDSALTFLPQYSANQDYIGWGWSLYNWLTKLLNTRHLSGYLRLQNQPSLVNTLFDWSTFAIFIYFKRGGGRRTFLLLNFPWKSFLIRLYPASIVSISPIVRDTLHPEVLYILPYIPSIS